MISPSLPQTISFSLFYVSLSYWERAVTGQLGDHLIVSQGQTHHISLEFNEIPSSTFPLSYKSPATSLAEPSQTLLALKVLRDRGGSSAGVLQPAGHQEHRVALLPFQLIHGINCPGREVKTSPGAFIGTPWTFPGFSVGCSPQSHRRHSWPQPL